MPRAGLRYSARLTWALAAQWWGYRWEHFCALDGDDQSFLVAVFEEKMTIDAVLANDLRKKMK